jgi:hypothetical protein
MANKYLALVSGKIKEIAATVVSAGAADAGKIVALDSAGLLDASLMPVGVGATVVTAPASENLTAGNFVNLWNDSGTLKVRKADATTNAKPAHGFVLANVTAPANATVYLLSEINTAVSGLTIGADYYLSTTPGGVTTTPPSASGNIVQFIGTATQATALPFLNVTTIEVA